MFIKHWGEIHPLYHLIGTNLRPSPLSLKQLLILLIIIALHLLLFEAHIEHLPIFEELVVLPLLVVGVGGGLHVVLRGRVVLVVDVARAFEPVLVLPTGCGGCGCCDVIGGGFRLLGLIVGFGLLLEFLLLAGAVEPGWLLLELLLGFRLVMNIYDCLIVGNFLFLLIFLILIQKIVLLLHISLLLGLYFFFVLLLNLLVLMFLNLLLFHFQVLSPLLQYHSIKLLQQLQYHFSQLLPLKPPIAIPLRILIKPIGKLIEEVVVVSVGEAGRWQLVHVFEDHRVRNAESQQ